VSWVSSASFCKTFEFLLLDDGFFGIVFVVLLFVVPLLPANLLFTL